METLEFVIKGKTVKMEALGFVGHACEAEMAEAERALGITVDSVLKDEYYRTAKGETRQETGL